MNREQKNNRWTWATFIILSLLQILLLFSSLVDKSVTIDEFAHLPAGLNVLSSGDFRYCELNPPLMNVLSSLPLRAMGINPPPPLQIPEAKRHSFWVNAYVFMNYHRHHYHRIFIVARMMTVGIVILLGLLIFSWARILVPERRNTAALLSVTLIWFSPNIMGHAQLVTTDVGITFFMMLSVFSLFLFIRKQTILRAVICGITLGLAQLVKFTAVYLYITHFITLTTVFLFRRPHMKARRLITLVLTIYCISILVINAGYCFQGTGKVMDNFSFVSAPFKMVKKFLPLQTPLPLPENYLSAFDQQLADTLRGAPSFLFGRSYQGGSWYYIFALVAVKIPLPCLFLALLALYFSFTKRGLERFDQFLIVFPALVIFIMFSFFSNKQIGLRMVLPALVAFLFWVGTTLASVKWSRKITATVGCLLIWFGIESFTIYPDYLTYFNQLVGGAEKGHFIAVDSNLDWGQDLPKLKRYLSKHNLNSIQLLYFGSVDPSIYGINYEVPLSGIRPGYLAVSRSLYGRGHFLYDHGELSWAGPFKVYELPFFKKVASLGHSIDVYKVEKTVSPEEIRY